MRKLIVLTALVTVVMTACASDSGSSGADEETLPTVPPGSFSSTIADPSLEPGDPQPPTGGEGQDLPGKGSDVDQMVEDSVADLADRLAVDSHAITIAKVESVTWRDGSMGCPEPGMSYTQALVDGVRVELTLDGESYWYHQGGSNPIRFCEDPREPLEGSPDA